MLIITPKETVYLSSYVTHYEYILEKIKIEDSGRIYFYVDGDWWFYKRFKILESNKNDKIDEIIDMLKGLKD